MSNILGKNLTLTLFGESHGPLVGGTLDGLPSGIEVNEASIADALSKRRPAFAGETARVENDDFEIVSGVYQGKTTGEPLTILIKNSNVHSKSYENLQNVYRPNHADYVAHVKYHGNEDPRGGGHFSGRITAAIVACGAIVETYLEEIGISVGAHVASIGSIHDKLFGKNVPEEIASLQKKPFPLLDGSLEEKMKELLKEIAEEGDSIGGSVEVAIAGLPVGLGEPWFDSLDGKLANAVFSIGGIRGVRFGDIENIGEQKGSEFNDRFASVDGGVLTKTNHSGGVQGGISNGMPVVFTALVKPTPSIYKEQDTVTKDGEATKLSIEGRHDPCIVRRVAPVLKAVSALVVADLLLAAFGRMR